MKMLRMTAMHSPNNAGELVTLDEARAAELVKLGVARELDVLGADLLGLQGLMATDPFGLERNHPRLVAAVKAYKPPEAASAVIVPEPPAPAVPKAKPPKE